MHVWLYNISFSVEALWYKNIANLYMSTEVSQGTIVGPFLFSVCTSFVCFFFILFNYLKTDAPLLSILNPVTLKYMWQYAHGTNLAFFKIWTTLSKLWSVRRKLNKQLYFHCACKLTKTATERKVQGERGRMSIFYLYRVWRENFCFRNIFSAIVLLF